MYINRDKHNFKSVDKVFTAIKSKNDCLKLPNFAKNV
jgi:hypothetical protein